MYQEYWGLEEPPFHYSLDSQSFFKSAAINEALARLHFMVNNGYRLGLLLGPSGVGKTAVLGRLGLELKKARRHVVQISLTGMDHEEFVGNLATQLGESRSLDKPVHALWRTIEDRLTVNRYQQLSTVLLLDDADDAEHDVLMAVARLSHWQPALDSRLTIVMSVDEGRVQLLARRLLELCELRIELTPWEQIDTAQYLKMMLTRAGRQHPAFDVTSLERIHELSQGMPRRVRQIAELALVAGAGQHLMTIDVETVDTVHDELSVPASPVLL